MAIPTINSLILEIITGAANDALDFKFHDSDSITTITDCIESRFYSWCAKERFGFESNVAYFVWSQLNDLGFKFKYFN